MFSSWKKGHWVFNLNIVLVAFCISLCIFLIIQLLIVFPHSFYFDMWLEIGTWDVVFGFLCYVYPHLLLFCQSYKYCDACKLFIVTARCNLPLLMTLSLLKWSCRNFRLSGQRVRSYLQVPSHEILYLLYCHKHSCVFFQCLRVIFSILVLLVL